MGAELMKKLSESCKKLNRNHRILICAAFAATLIAVSYTHLDVYKRQTDNTLKKDDNGKYAEYVVDVSSEKGTPDVITCLLYTSRCV